MTFPRSELPEFQLPEFQLEGGGGDPREKEKPATEPRVEGSRDMNGTGASMNIATELLTKAEAEDALVTKASRPWNDDPDRIAKQWLQESRNIHRERAAAFREAAALVARLDEERSAAHG